MQPSSTADGVVDKSMFEKFLREKGGLGTPGFKVCDLVGAPSKDAAEPINPAQPTEPAEAAEPAPVEPAPNEPTPAEPAPAEPTQAEPGPAARVSAASATAGAGLGSTGSRRTVPSEDSQFEAVDWSLNAERWKKRTCAPCSGVAAAPRDRGGHLIDVEYTLLHTPGLI